MAGVIAFAAVVRLWGRKRKVPVTAEPPALGGIDVSDRTFTFDADDFVSEAEDGTYVPFAFLNLHGHATIHGFRLASSPLVAEGGQGRVFKAECVEEGRLGLHKGEVVALKFVEETPSSSFEEFQKAVEYLREIKSPHIPRYYGCFRVERTIKEQVKRYRMTVMEYLDGADLGYRVKVRSPMFYADEIMYVIDQLLEGLCELTAAEIVHRDIKPSNVFICRDGTVKLIDFGTALIHGIDLCPKDQKIVGTPEFAAPDYLAEGFRGDEISDVFSVGMVLYYMVHGVSPQRAEGTLSGRMDERTWRDVWMVRCSNRGTEDWCVWKQPPNDFKTWGGWTLKSGFGDWLSGKARLSVPLLGLPGVLRRALAVERTGRFASWREFRSSLANIKFVQACHEEGHLRVISGLQCTSSAGAAGCWCVYGRDESGCVKEWSIPDIIFIMTDGRGDLQRILCGNLYDLDWPTGWWLLGWPLDDEQKRLLFEKSRIHAVPPPLSIARNSSRAKWLSCGSLSPMSKLLKVGARRLSIMSL